MKSALPKPALDQLAREQRAVADVHPDADVLTAFCEGALMGAERGRVMEHIARCGDCREVVFLAAPEALSQLAVAEEKIAGSTAEPVVSWWRRYMPAVAAAAAVVVVGSAVLLEPNLMRSRKAAPQSEAAPVASNETAQPSPANAPVPQESTRSKEVVSKVAPQSGATAETAVADKSAEPAMVGGLVSGSSADARKRDEAQNSLQFQRQAVASGPHGPVEPKGNSSNYQNVAVTPQQRAWVAPGPRGELEAKGNSLSMSNAAPQVTKEQVTVSGGFAPVTSRPATANDQLALRADVSNVPVRGRNVAPPAAAPVAKAKSVEKKLEIDSAKTSQSGESDRLVAADAYKPGDSDGITVGSQDPQPSPMTKDFANRYHFRIDDEGELQKSLGNDDWRPALAKAQARVHVVSVMGSNVWAGGSHGKLFRSLDGGEHWTSIQIKSDGKPLSETITSIKFHNLRSGTITTDSGAVWETTDGGMHWRKR